MNTAIENIVDNLEKLEKRLLDFLSAHSDVKRTDYADDVLSLSGDYTFIKLKPEAIPVQDRLYKDFNQVFNIINVLISDSPSNRLKKFKKNRNILDQCILQTGMMPLKSIEDVKATSKNAIHEIIQLITCIFPKSLEKPILVVDTNSLYQLPEIEKWTFSDFSKFELIITPSVLKDLDKHKIEHSNEVVRSKAKKIIRKLKEYRRRGKLLEGVTIVKEKISLRTIAVEPKFENTLKWLDPNNDDDRLIAELLEIIKNHGGTSVFMVTGDINLQNKCEAADLSFFEPPK
ncbi:MAG: PIN domain-containing protein [Bacteroidales bacterium]